MPLLDVLFIGSIICLCRNKFIKRNDCIQTCDLDVFGQVMVADGITYPS
uniref:Uncharacterized protein n=1 Tax=Rhizophora mucronata TaxID=61149 RepID=A0A2P2NZT4_RHIMU